MRQQKKKTLADYEKQRQHKNERQREYRRENKELCEVWTQRTYSNYLRARGWTVTPPPGFPTLEQVHTKRDLLRQMEGPPVDLSDFDFDIDPDELPFP